MTGKHNQQGVCFADLFLHALHAAGIRRVDGKSAGIDFLATYKAITEIACFNATQRTVDPDQLLLTPAACLLRHFLCLHGVHAGQPAYPGLIQLHGPGGFLRVFLKVKKLGLQTKQLRPKLFSLCFIHWLLLLILLIFNDLI